MIDYEPWSNRDDIDQFDRYTSPLPRERPWRKRRPEGDQPLPGFMRVRVAEYETLVNSTQQAWDDYAAAREQQDPPPNRGEKRILLVSPDGQLWATTIDDAGNLDSQKVVR